MITYGSTTLTSYNTITKIEVYYYKSTSATSLSGGSWSTTKPTWENGKYIWQKIRTTYEGKLENGQYYSESNPVNITGQQGATGTAAYSYKLNASDTIITKSEKGEYSVSKIIFTATYKQGTSAITSYSGRFKIETTNDGITWTTVYPASGTGINESSKEFTIPDNILSIRCSLYQAGGLSILLDQMTIPIINDGVGTIDPPYKQVEWVESTGKQYVYLDWKPQIKTWGFEVDFMNQNAVNTTMEGWNESTNKNGYGTIFGVRNSSGVNNVQLSSYNNGLLRIGNSTAITTGFKTDHSRQTIKLHGTTITRANGTTATVTRVDENTAKPYCNMAVFGLYEGLRRTSTGNITEPSSTRIYSLKFYDGDTLAVDLIGSIRKADGITGLYDKVSKHFYPAPGMLFGDEVGDIANIDTVAESLNKADVSTTVVNKNRSRMWETSVPFNRLEDGQKITVTYSYGNVVNSTQTSELVGWDDTSSNNNVYLRLIYPDGTKSEWIPCYYSQTARLTTHYGAGTAITFTYRENLLSNATETTAGSSIVRGFFANASYYQNTSYTQYSNNIKAGTNGIKGYNLVMKDSENTWSCFYSGAYKTTNTGKPAYTGGFILGKILYSAGAGAQTSNSSLDTYYNYKLGVNTSTVYDAYPVDLRYSTNCASTLTTQHPVYIVGTIESDGLFYLDVSQWYTQTEPTYADGKVYVYVGMAYSSYQVWLSTENPAYMFYNGEFILYDKALTLQNINSLKTSLETQIDNKVETWCQKTNPASNWTAEERPNHTGDLWYYIGESDNTYKNNTTYQYNGETNVWSAYSANPDLFDKIDGKSAIYYGTQSSVTSAEEGDYLVNSTDGSSYRWNNGAWVKVTDYKTAINNIQIGGRNLLRNTSITRTGVATKYGLFDILRPTYSSLYALDLDEGEYTLSFDWESSIELPASFYAWIGYGDINGQGRAEMPQNIPAVYTGKDSTSGHYVRTFIWANANDTYPYFACRPFRTSVEDALNDIEFTIKNAKLEKGNKATDWTPAPEDVSADIQQVQNNLNNLEIGGRNLFIGTSRFHGENNAFVTESNKLDNYYTYFNNGSIYTLEPFHEGEVITLQAKSNIPWNNRHATDGTGINTVGFWIQAFDTSEDAKDRKNLKRSQFLTNDLGDNNTIFKKTWTIPTSDDGKYYCFRFNSYSDGTTVVTAKFWDLKLEKGNKSTDWSPAPEDVEEEISTLRTDLQSQIDEKIQTYYQSTNPASSWTTTELRTPHDGDLWYYTGTSTSTYTKDNVYRYNASNNTWSVYSASGELFDKVDGKSTIYYGTTSGTYTGVETGDYLVDSTDGSSYRWDGSKWVKVTDYKTTITNAIDDIEIGGRNLLIKKELGIYAGGNITYNTNKISATETGVLTNDLTVGGQIPGWKISGLTGNVNIIVHGITNLPSEKVVLYYTCWNGTTKTKAQASFPKQSVSSDGSFEYKATLVIPPESTYITLGFGQLSASTYELSSLKLEKGNKATDWTPAPEDTTASIQAYVDTLQFQVDHMAEIYYGTAVPTLSNAPASSWNTNDIKDIHVDDLYYNTSTGYCYRFTKSGSTYSWTRIKDSDITAAATAASNANTAAGNAQTTANNANTLAGQKRRIFVAQPTLPYEVGDLWVEGSNGDIKKCKTARATGSYTASDWELASKYTDDTLANEANDKIDNLEIGGRNLLPFKDCSSETLTRGGITLTKEEDGWIRVSGTRSGTSLTTFTLWQNPDGDTYTAPINSYVPQNGNTNQFTLSVETEGTPFIMGNTYTSSTHIVAYGSTSGTSWRIGGINGTSITGVFPTYMSVIRYYIGANSTGTVNGRFRVKLERGNKATDWTPAPEDTETAISDVQDTANIALIQSSWYAICDTAGATIDKVATISPATTSFTLREGTTAIIKFVNTNSGAIGSLKLDVNNTGAKPIKYIYNGGLSDIPSAGYLKGGQSYQFYYDGTNWVVQMIYNTNTNTVGVYGGTVTAGTNGIRGYTLIMRDTENTWVSITTDAGAGTKDGGTGTNHVKYAGGLYPDSVMYESTQTNYAAGASAAVCYLALSLNLRYSTNCGTTLIKNKPVYLVGELHNDGLFYLDDIWWTQTIPTTENGKTYIYLGMAYSNYQIYLATEKPMYQYYDGEFMTYEDVQTALAAKSATNYMSSDNTGIMVADLADGEQLPANATGENVFITAGYGEGEAAVDMGVHIRNGQEDLAIFGETTRIGKENDSNVSIDNNGIIINKGSKELAKYFSKGITFDEETPYKIGNDNSYITFEDTDNDNKADSLSIVADSIYFRDTANTNIKDTLNGLQSDLTIAQEDIDLKNNYIKINTSEPSIVISASSDTNDANLKLESSQLSFQIDGQTTATITNDQMNIPTASVTNLFMQSTNTSTNTVYEKVWVMRTNGHLSLKTITRN